MKHQWKDCEETTQEVIISEAHIEMENTISKAFKCKECVICGLKKGLISKVINNWRKMNRTIYFEENKVLSLNVLPYRCFKEFLDEKEFLI